METPEPRQKIPTALIRDHTNRSLEYPYGCCSVGACMLFVTPVRSRP